MSLPVVYICAPLSAPTREGIEANRRNAIRWFMWAVSKGVAPIADWIIMTGELAETPENRARGLACDLALVERCDEVWLVGGRISSGMELEAAHARKFGRTVVDLTHLGFTPPEESRP